MAHLCKLPGLGRETVERVVEQLSASSPDRASGMQPGGGHPLAPPTGAMAMAMAMDGGGGGGGGEEYQSHAHHPSSAEPPLGGPLHPLTGSCQSPAGLTGSSSYTTLTPLQPPLPPISTVSPKFPHHPQSHPQAHHRLAGNFTLLSDNLYPSPYPKEVAGLGQTLSPLGGLHNTQQALSHYADAGVAMPAEKMLTPSGFEAQHPPLLARPGDQHLTQSTACLVPLGGIPRQPHTHLSARGHGQIQASSREPKPAAAAAAAQGSAGNHSGQLEEINTKDVAQRITTELKRYSIPQAIFAQRVLGRSQGTLSDLLRNPKPWSKLKSGRETFRRMWKWLQEPEFQRMSALRLAACKRKEQDQGKDRGNALKKPRLVFTDVQRRTLYAIFKENKRPSKELQITISHQLGLELSTVSNFFMNARRRSLDKWQVEGCADSGSLSSSSSTCTKA
ncbi:hepatocyte nuclear factor 6 [Protobothrops mucrosquamatus]|uniref:hepatocyte nuclear factor 6 n=1 Tax=Protobothrops mucrosquamatus TaxID=103944 RepID=UPI000775FCD5|nr:hepatocyte nuclear factor 6 [Protobothrops mucrosquamatus]